MKKTILFLAAICLFAVGAIAQSRGDSSRHHHEGSAGGTWAKVETADIPAALQETLKGSDYAGWTVATVSVNAEKTKYKVEMTQSGETKVHFFDQNGKPIVRKRGT